MTAARLLAADRPEPFGLSEATAEQRLLDDGPNALPMRDRRGVLAIVLEVMREPMFVLLLVGGGVYAAIGDLKEALLLLAFASLSVAIAVIQEFRSEKVLSALRDLSSPTATVIRAGQRRRIESTKLVRGDIVALAEGDRVPADALVRRAGEFEVDESLLTGESVPVRKRATVEAVTLGAPGGEETPFLYSGSLVVRGQAIAEVAATGPRSELGKLGRTLESIVSKPGRLTLEVRRIVRVVGIAAIAICAALVILFGVLRGAWVKGVLAGVALGMAMLPEEFPLVLTVFMVMGAWRISRAKVLTKRAAAIETLGAATVLCADKTGTMTENHMSFIAAWVGGAFMEWTPGASLPEAVQPLARTSLLASAPHPFDPMERAFHDACAGWFAPPPGLTLERSFGITPKIMAVTQVWAEAGSEARRIAAKGAPEAIARLCRLSPAETAGVMLAVETMAARGLRVLAAAEAEEAGSWAPGEGGPLRLVGLVGLADPLRSDVAAAVQECHSAGVRVVMVTGDYPATAAAIAGQAGLAPGDVLTGAELNTLSDAQFAQKAAGVSVFARILPEQKLRIVKALQAIGEVVAMTGDGVNDAPALKVADIGIAMGGRGVDVAREAASLVLLNDDFGSIVTTMRLGRRIYDNLQKAMGFILAVHVPIAGLALAPLLLGMPVFLAPAHIAFLEMIIDPACALVFEAEREEAGIMRRRPRSPDAPVFTRGRVMLALAEGVMMLIVVGSTYGICQAWGRSPDQVRTVAFLAMVFSTFGLIEVSRSFTGAGRANAAFAWILAGVLAALAAIIAAAPARQLFHFGPIDAAGAALAAAAGATSYLGLRTLRHLAGHRATGA